EHVLNEQLEKLVDAINNNTKAYAIPLLYGQEIQKAFQLRAAGLGLLSNLSGDKKGVTCIEDTAVRIKDLSNYIAEFTKLLRSYDQEAVYYAHAGAGELHLRPILDLKKKEDVIDFRNLTKDVATLVKKYNGSLSGEHGDGIVRGSLIQDMIGEQNFNIIKKIKTLFDPNNIMNPGKIVNAFPMDEQLRYEVDRSEPKIETFFDFSSEDGILKAIEKCNGSGDCRKSVEAGGTMCPSFQATKDEKDSTRGRANVFREVLTHSTKANRFNSDTLREVLDLCLSCKACKSECPSNVDMATFKAEFQFQYQEANGYTKRNQFIAKSTAYNEKARKFLSISNFLLSNTFTSSYIKSYLGFAQERSLPKLSKQTLRSWLNENIQELNPTKAIPEIVLFVDEFTDQLEAHIGIKAVKLLT
ncbi:MAG: FAD-linked oxidase C-terminal domain-containing protein, partial [Bacteroidota bacterium]